MKSLLQLYIRDSKRPYPGPSYPDAKVISFVMSKENSFVVTFERGDSGVIAVFPIMIHHMLWFEYDQCEHADVTQLFYENITGCKYIKRIGESCTLNNNCKYPNCEPTVYS